MISRDELEKELNNLRMSLRRVGELAKSRGAIVTIPEQGQARGWNLLCADLMDFLERIE